MRLDHRGALMNRCGNQFQAHHLIAISNSPSSIGRMRASSLAAASSAVGSNRKCTSYALAAVGTDDLSRACAAGGWLATPILPLPQPAAARELAALSRPSPGRASPIMLDVCLGDKLVHGGLLLSNPTRSSSSDVSAHERSARIFSSLSRSPLSSKSRYGNGKLRQPLSHARALSSICSEGIRSRNRERLRRQSRWLKSRRSFQRENCTGGRRLGSSASIALRQEQVRRGMCHGRRSRSPLRENERQLREPQSDRWGSQDKREQSSNQHCEHRSLGNVISGNLRPHLEASRYRLSTVGMTAAEC
jgi:hypothetical protein